MSLLYLGQTFSINDQWGKQEHMLINLIKQQIEYSFANSTNLLINATWFGPQFENSAWYTVQSMIAQNKKFDRIFWVSSVDPLYILPDQFKQIEQGLGADQVYYLGGFDNSPHNFHLSAVATLEDFIDYLESDLLPLEFKKMYVCYNRKPKPHRIQLVEKIYQNQLQSHGILTLGKNDVDYDVTQGMKTDLFLTLEDPVENYSHNGKFLVHNNFGGVPYDLCSLGRLDIWQTHFLNIVSETEFLPWDNLFVTEKTWKPIIGLRPFIINGQTKLYQWLRNQGFLTFNHYWPHIEMENITELEVHDSIVAVIKHLATQNLDELYQDMLPALKHNHNRFFEFAREQKFKMENLFE
jgi:hypothetical protein